MELRDKKVVVTRERSQAGEMMDLLRARGAVPVLFPTIEVHPPRNWGPLDNAMAFIDKYQWVVFTSVNGVRCFSRRVKALGSTLKGVLLGKKICAIGPATARALGLEGIAPTLVPPRFVAEEVLEALLRWGVAGEKVLLPRAEVARQVLPDGLRRAGAQVDVVPVYRIVAPVVTEEAKRRVLKADVFTFTSPSTARNFLEIMGGFNVMEVLAKGTVASIGPITTEALRGLEVRVDVEAQEYTVVGLIRALDMYQPQRTFP